MKHNMANKRRHFFQKKKNLTKEVDYEGMINSLMLEKHLALEPLNYLDEEENEIESQREKKIQYKPLENHFCESMDELETKLTIQISRSDFVEHFNFSQIYLVHDNDVLRVPGKNPFYSTSSSSLVYSDISKEPIKYYI